MRALVRLAFVLVVAATTFPASGRSPGQGALDRGAAQYKQGHYSDALDSFRKATDLDPTLIKAWENVGWAQYRLGNDREALRVWSTVLKLQPQDVSSWNAVGELHFGRRAWDEAASAFESSLALNADQWDVRLRLGQAYEKLLRADEAAAQYGAILEHRSGDVKATLRLAVLEESRGRLDEAESTLRAGLARGRDPDGQLSASLARVLAKIGDEAFRGERYSAAADVYREAASRAPDRTLYLVNLGWAERKAGNNAAAVASWRASLDRGVAEPEELWRAVGDACRDDGRLADARDAYARAAAKGPAAGAALFSLATMAMEGGDVDGAVSSLREMFASGTPGEDDAARSAELFIRHGAIPSGLDLFEEIGRDPARASVAAAALARLHAASGSAAYRAGDNAAAWSLYREALEADPRNRAALRDGGWALWRLGDWDGVRRVWSDYGAAFPTLAEPHELMGRLELQHGDPKKAIEQAQRALAIDGEAKGPEILLAKGYLADGKFHRARELGLSLASAYPDDLPAQTLYAEALWRSLDFEAAKVQWRRVIDLGGDTPRAMHYWLRSTYETGAYDVAIAQAEALFDSGRATEPVIRLLAEDARVRDDDKASARWYGALTARFPQRIAYWTALADVYRTAENPRAEAPVLERALLRHPDSPELLLRHAEVQRTLGRPKRALDEYRASGARLGRNRSAFEGELGSLQALARYDEALALVRSEGADYLDADERALKESSILEGLGRRDEAATVRRRLTSPPDGSVVLPVLLYHGIAEHERTVNVPLDRFEGEMQAIHDAGFTTITVSELDAMLGNRAPFPERPILVSFDDARGDSLRYADPVLARLGMKATMFVPTIRIADESAFNTDWATLRRLAESGRWDFQAHGHLAHDPVAIDGDGALAEFLVNRQWLADEQRMETHEEFVARVEADYATCKERLTENLPGQSVVGYAFPFSEMGQLHGGNDPEALDVNEAAFRRLYRFGFTQDSFGYNTLLPGDRGPLLLHRLGVPREWDGDRLLAHLAALSPRSRARTASAEADIANAKYRGAESTLRAMIAEEPKTYPEAGVPLASGLHEQGREREAASTYLRLPTGTAWGRPDASRRKLGRDIAWETQPQARAEARAVSDSDGRDSYGASATGRYPLSTPVDLWGSVGTESFRDDTYTDPAGTKESLRLAGLQLGLGAEWVGGAHVAAGGWLRARSLDFDVKTLEGEATVRGFVDGHRFGAACGLTDVETAGALLEGIQRRGCALSYDALGRTFRSRTRLTYADLTDGNAVAYGWADATRILGATRHLEIGGRLELGDSRASSRVYYAPSKLVSAFGIVRYSRAFPSGASLDAEAGVGPSRDAGVASRVVSEARLGWTQDWRPRWRSTLTAEYGATSGYHRTGVGFSFGYRF